ncbi:MAG: hypothetical protein OXC63_04195 [Aestuariivita sp.]|nr:hypothetical protein [Aestuariivita sp.]MCY4345730.1 hypothetical protein [Aestuariivita sp.]
MKDFKLWILAFLDAHVAEFEGAENAQLAYTHDLNDFSTWLQNNGTNASFANFVLTSG